MDAKIKNTILFTMAQNTNKIFRCNFKKTCIRSAFSKLHKTDERSQTHKKPGNISIFHVLEDSNRKDINSQIHMQFN